MPLSDVEEAICKAVVSRYIAQNKPTSRRSLLKDFKGAVPDALNRLVNLTVLKGVANTTDAFLPTSLAFRWCGDSNMLRFGKHSVEVVLRTLHFLFDRDLELPEQPEYTPADIEVEAKKLKALIEPETIRVGLYLAGEYGVFASIRSDPEYTEIVGLKIGERILTIGEIDKAWDDHIQQWGARLESEKASDIENPKTALHSEGLTSSNEQADPEAIAEAAAHAEEEVTAAAANTRLPARPSVYISYAPEDHAWHSRIATQLKNAGFDLLDRPPTTRTDLVASTRQKAQVFVLLASTYYFASDEILKIELPHIRSISQARARRAIGVILAPCTWQSFLGRREFLTIPKDGRALAEGSPDQIREDLHTLAREVRRAIKESDKATVQKQGGQPLDAQSDWIDQPTFDRFSEAARIALALAQAIGMVSKTPVIHTQLVLLALRELALKDEATSRTRRESPRQLTTFLTSHDKDLVEILAPIPPIQSTVPRPLISPPRVSVNARRALQTAIAKAGPSDPIEDTHLLFGVLSSARNARVRRLNKCGMTPDLVPLQSAAPSVVERQSVLAGYQSDDPSGTDLLGISDEVRALASVLAAKDVDPPLSLGLFGDWGAGKSFFMHQLETRIRELQDDAKLANGESAYCRNIVQITFNAWNYIDCNLWASLTAEIFENLAGAIAQTRGEDSPEERALVLAAASSSQAVLAEAEKKRTEAEHELKQTEERLTALQKSEAELEATLDSGEILRQAFRFAMQDDQVQKQLDAAASALHIPAGVAAANEVRSEIIELQGSGNAIILTLKNKRYLWVWIIVLSLALGVCWLLPRLIFETPVALLVTRAVAILTAASAFLAPLVNASRKAMLLVEKANASRVALVEQKRKEQTDKVKAARGQIQQKVEAARRSVDDATAKAKALNEQLEKMRADRRMADYIRQRHQSVDYTQHLGIISRVRADLQHLSTLLRAVKEETERDAFEAGMKERQAEKDRERQSKGKQPLFPRIDRIVLYIDDLDRCREENVVDVLQAVHLLLAFPLFVVVVGVDPRWLLHSLRQNSQAFQDDEIENGAGRLTEEERHWVSTPLNYLEKIFQIPFSLRPIEKKGFGNIVDAFAMSMQRPETTSGEVPRRDEHEEPNKSLVTVQPQTQQAQSPGPDYEEPPISSEQGEQTNANVTEVSTQPSTSPSPTAPSAIDRNPAQLQIQDWERAFMKELDEFIPTPRAGKRFLNIYRLLRASIKRDELEAFTGSVNGGGYQIAALLLAILTGYPTQATEILRLLTEEELTGSWWDFVSSLKTRLLDGSASVASKELKEATHSSEATSSSADAAEGKSLAESRTDRASWVELFERLDKVKALVNDRPCGQFAKWAPRVARYSFQSGRVLYYQRR